MSNLELMKLMLVAEECKAILGISDRIMENLRLVTHYATYSKRTMKLKLDEQKLEVICGKQQIIPKSLKEYVASFKKALDFLATGKKSAASGALCFGEERINVRHLIIRCLISAGIADFKDLNNFWVSKRRKPLRKPAKDEAMRKIPVRRRKRKSGEASKKRVFTPPGYREEKAGEIDFDSLGIPEVIRAGGRSIPLDYEDKAKKSILRIRKGNIDRFHVMKDRLIRLSETDIDSVIDLQALFSGIFSKKKIRVASGKISIFLRRGPNSVTVTDIGYE
ncbi:MAG: hypothetical protein WC831_02815 [Parcubacteria group bacterium]|jgi:hypothetical protein